MESSAGDRRGILNPLQGEAHFAFARHAPSAALADVVERYWSVRWDLRDKPAFEQETLPFPCVNLVAGTHRAGVHGVPTSRFVARLEGSGWVIGAKFRPGAFSALCAKPASELTDRDTPIGRLFGSDGDAFERAVHETVTDGARLESLDTFLASRRRGPLEPEALLAGRAVDRAHGDPGIARVADLAAAAGIGVRSLQRIFATYIGVPPKWVIRRFRVQEAAERLARGSALDLSRMALDLGYFDQAHFIRDFKAQVGQTPSDYAATCARAASVSP
jgi:AraC-like DNA-binding protein